MKKTILYIISITLSLIMVGCNHKVEPLETAQPSTIMIEEKGQEVFNYGEDFTSVGLTIKLLMTDNSKKILTSTEYTVNASSYDKNKVGEYKIIVSLINNPFITTSYTVRVQAPPINETTIKLIKIDASQTKLVYTTGENFSSENLKVYGVLENDSVVLLDSNYYTLDKNLYNNTKQGSYKISVSFNYNTSLKASYTVNVLDEGSSLDVISIVINTKNVKSIYKKGEPFLYQGLKQDLIVYAISNEKNIIQLMHDEYTLNADKFDSSSPGFYEIKITYNNNNKINAVYSVLVK